ncbi:transcriptional regulator [Colwellia psychrerythraea]|uniref:Transcriptional regulator n=1 Tax=Colwellia psychrerythraea TaxID=28229 RepID=A0A1Y5E0Z7_COLPS|nr:transcriptional regulator [Colwellia psychrerythraea]
MAKATIKDVARVAEVSVKTVSRVLNNEPNVRPVLQEKVHAAVKALDFKRNPLARGLRGQQSFIITLLYSNPNPGYILELQNGALAQCIEQGYNLQVHPCDHNSPDLLKSVESITRYSSQDGFILTHPLCDNKELLAMLDEKGIPFVRISPFTQEHSSPYVMSDDESAAYEITKYLISLGHSSIGFIKGHPDFGATHKRYQGYQRALKEMAIGLDETIVKQGLFTFESGETCARQLLSQKDRPSAIFASNDYMAAAVLKVAAQMKISIPAELSVVGYDNAPVSQQIWPSITTVKQPIQRMAESVVEKLIRQIKKQPFDDIQTKFECELITRNSTSPCA